MFFYESDIQSKSSLVVLPQIEQIEGVDLSTDFPKMYQGAMPIRRIGTSGKEFAKRVYKEELDSSLIYFEEAVGQLRDSLRLINFKLQTLNNHNQLNELLFSSNFYLDTGFNLICKWLKENCNSTINQKYFFSLNLRCQIRLCIRILVSISTCDNILF